MVKKHRLKHRLATVAHLRSVQVGAIGILGFLLIAAAGLLVFIHIYAGKIYPGVVVNGMDVGGKTPAAIKQQFLAKNAPFEQLSITFASDDYTATVAGQQLDIGFDATLSAHQAYLVGRASGSFASNLLHILTAYTDGIMITPLFRYNTEIINKTLAEAAQFIDVPAQDAQFVFANGKTTSFRLSKPGRSLAIAATKQQLANTLDAHSAGVASQNIHIPLIVETVEPSVTTDETNDFGIVELIGRGESFFRGSITGREHNIVLAADRVNGTLVPPGEIFSFNQTVGDISAATGYKQAYIIKDGRTILDDGGGVCQVSTTLFRAVLDTGLPIEERWAHSYRVSYYEQGGWEPGFDATIFAPYYDLKFRNDTNHHILVQMDVDMRVKKLVFELYGTNDGRVANISNARTWDVRPAPPALYQPDPTLPAGTTKQVDYAAAGARTAFDYQVVKNGQMITQDSFQSNFIPWQAVYLTGPES